MVEVMRDTQDQMFAAAMRSAAENRDRRMEFELKQIQLQQQREQDRIEFDREQQKQLLQYEMEVDRERTNEIMDTMLAFFEPSLLEPRDVVTPAIQQQMLSAIVGCEISIDRIEAKEKLGQLRSVDDQRGTVAGLSATQRRDAGALLDYMNDRKLGIGNSDT